MKDPDFFDAGDLVAVLTTQPLDRTLDYKAPEGGCWLGAFVEVPLGPRKVLGVVWGKGRGDWDISKVRSVNRVLDVAPMRSEMRTFLEKAAAYTLTSLPSMLRLASRAPGLSDPPSMRKVYRLGEGTPERVTEALKLPNEGGSLILYDDRNCIIDHVTWSKYELRRNEEGMAYMF